MKLTIKNGSIFGVASLMLILIFGTDTPSHLKAAVQTARDHLFGALSTEHLVKVGREQLTEQQDKLVDAEVGLENQRENVQAAEDKVKELDAQLTETRRRLELLRPAFESGSGIGEFSSADVEEDVKALLDFADRTAKFREQQAERLKNLRSALAAHEEILEQAREDYAAAEDHLEGLASELEAREAAAGAEALAGAIRNELSNGREGINRTVDALDDRKKKLELEASRTPSGSGLPKGRVILEGDRAEATRSLRDRLDTFVPKAGGSTDAAPQPTPLPAASDGASIILSEPAPVRIGSGSATRCRS